MTVLEVMVTVPVVLLTRPIDSVPELPVIVLAVMVTVPVVLLLIA